MPYEGFDAFEEESHFPLRDVSRSCSITPWDYFDVDATEKGSPTCVEDYGCFNITEALVSKNATRSFFFYRSRQIDRSIYKILWCDPWKITSHVKTATTTFPQKQHLRSCEMGSRLLWRWSSHWLQHFIKSGSQIVLCITDCTECTHHIANGYIQGFQFIEGRLPSWQWPGRVPWQIVHLEWGIFRRQTHVESLVQSYQGNQEVWHPHGSCHRRPLVKGKSRG